MNDPVEEAEANMFAIELLMPESWIRSDVQRMNGIDIVDGDGIRKLAKRYGVTEQMMALRIGQLYPKITP